LDGILREQSWKLRGIVNGIDYSEWSPQVCATLHHSREEMLVQSRGPASECRRNGHHEIRRPSVSFWQSISHVWCCVSYTLPKAVCKPGLSRQVGINYGSSATNHLCTSAQADKFLRSDGYRNYDFDSLREGKAACKAALQRVQR